MMDGTLSASLNQSTDQPSNAIKTTLNAARPRARSPFDLDMDLFGKDRIQFRRVPMTELYDFSQLNTPNDRLMLVELRLDRGQYIGEILIKYPELDPRKFVLECLDVEGEPGRDMDQLPKSVPWLKHNYLCPQPVQGAKCYYFRHIIEEFPNRLGVRALRNIAISMAPDSVVLIGAVVRPDRLTEKRERDRTENDWKRLITAAGMEIIYFHRVAEYGDVSLIEARLAQVD